MRTYPTRQAVFDAVWDHFVVKKNPKSVGMGRPLCLYSNTGCAIGCLIDDKELCKKMDDVPFAGPGAEIQTFIVDSPYTVQLCQYFPFLLDASNKLISREIAFLQAIQCAHDNSGCKAADDFHNDIKFYLEDEATEFQLAIPNEK